MAEGTVGQGGALESGMGGMRTGAGSATSAESSREPSGRARGAASAVASRLGGVADALRQGTQNVGDIERLASVVAGGALATMGLRKRGLDGALLAILGAALVHRGATGHCYAYGALDMSTAGTPLEKQHGRAAVLDASHAVKVEHSVRVHAPREELYRFWRDVENLPRIMNHIESVTALDDRRSHWKAKAPAGQSVEWDAEIHSEVEDTLIGWRSMHGATVPNAGSVHFTDVGGGDTEVRVILEYAPPGGKAGQMVAKLFGEEPDVQVREDLQRFKEEMERRGPGTGTGAGTLG